MKRRDFFTQTSLTGLAAGLPLSLRMIENVFSEHRSLLKPPRLRAGATVALIAPASPFTEEKWLKARQNFELLGFKIKEGQHLHAQRGYLAGTDEQRLSDLHGAFEDPDVDAVWCIRGGYGCTRLLPQIDFERIRKNPKPFIGYSDVTALHLAIQRRTGLVTFHGPVAAADFPENTLQHFRAALMEPMANYEIKTPSTLTELPGDEFRPFAIAPGKARGKLTGGNLSLLAALTGTSFSPVFKNKIVFLEDVGEQPYRIDRILTQLLQATDLSAAAAIALGVFLDCQPKPSSLSLTLEDMLRDRLGGLGIPVIYGLPFGHVAHQATFPYNVEAELNVSDGTLTLLEAGVN
ncbi:MAG: LD-carboxypeptidase [Saprospiraceae bacterium]|nr:LD-carboxypeptidase [Saprospiraceae bacterium]